MVPQATTQEAEVTPTITPAEISVVTVSDFVSVEPVSMPLLSESEISVSVGDNGLSDNGLNDDSLNGVRFASESYAELSSTTGTPLTLAGAHDLVDSLFSDEAAPLGVSDDLNDTVEDEFLSAWA